MFCPQCGTEAKAGALFCSHCGAKLPATGTAGLAQVNSGVAPQSNPSASSSVNSATSSSMNTLAQQQSNASQLPSVTNQASNQLPQVGGTMQNPYGPPNGAYVYSKYPPGWVSSPGIVENFKWCFLDNYVNFEGRATRQEYWYFQLATIILTLASGILTLGIGFYIAPLVFFLPNLAVTARRLHDTGRSTLWLLLSLTGLGSFVLLVFMCLESDPQPNEFGPLPDFRNYIPHGQRHKQNF